MKFKLFVLMIKVQKCYIVDGEPWLKGDDVASVLGPALPRNAIIGHIPEQFKQSFLSLMKLSSDRGSTKTERCA